MIYQLGALQGFCRIDQVKINHVKPHGAVLYDSVEKTEK